MEPERHSLHLHYMAQPISTALENVSPVPIITKQKFVFLHIKPYNKDFSIMYDVLHHFYDEPCSAESWSSLLTSLLASTIESKGPFQNPAKSIINACFLRRQIHRVIRSVR